MALDFYKENINISYGGGRGSALYRPTYKVLRDIYSSQHDTVIHKDTTIIPFYQFTVSEKNRATINKALEDPKYAFQRDPCKHSS